MGLPHYPFNYNSPYYANDSPQSKEWYKQNWTEFLGNSFIAKYTVDSIGSHIQNTSREQIQAIHETSNMISQVNSEGFMTIGNILALSMEQSASQNTAVINQLDNIARIERENLASSIEIKEALRDMDWRFGLMNEQLSAQNTLLSGIDKLLRIPESQKQRHFHIEYGLKFFKQAKSESEYISDALNHFLEAEKLLQSDSFVLYHIGIIYLYDATQVDLDKAIEYFKRAAKYSIIDKDDSSKSLIGIDRDEYYNNDEFTAKCHYHTAVASFISNNLQDALNNIEKALKYFPENTSYLFHKCKILANINQVEAATLIASKLIDIDIQFLLIILNDITLVKHKSITDLLSSKAEQFKSKINQVIDKLIKNLPYDSKYEKYILEIKELQKQNTLMCSIKINEMLERSHDYFNSRGDAITKFPYPILIQMLEGEIKLLKTNKEKVGELISTLDRKTYKAELKTIDKELGIQTISSSELALSMAKKLRKTVDNKIKSDLEFIKQQKENEQIKAAEIEAEIKDKYLQVLFIIWAVYSTSFLSDKSLKVKLSNMSSILKSESKRSSNYIKSVVAALHRKKTFPKTICNYNSVQKRYEIVDNWLSLLTNYLDEIKKSEKKEEFQSFLSIIKEINSLYARVETTTNFFGKVKYNENDINNSEKLEQLLDKY